MSRAIELAQLGIGSVSPNPMVGCVIVRDGTIIGEGWHKVFGGPHAEVNAVNSVEQKGLLDGADVYVSLEPCSHSGKTPPCTDLLIKSDVKRVVIGARDPNPEVSGNGVKKLKDAGISVTNGLLEKEAKWINRRFFTRIEKNRPYIILKWAQTGDGFIARENYDSKWISSNVSRKLVHKWRAEEDAILVGWNTAYYDNPSLNVRDWSGKNPIRMVLDPTASLPDHLNIFDGKSPTWIYTVKETSAKPGFRIIKMKEDSIEEILDDALRNNVSSIFVEGGAATLNRFIDLGLWDEARVFKSKKIFERGIKAPHLENPANRTTIGGDTLSYYFN